MEDLPASCLIKKQEIILIESQFLQKKLAFLFKYFSDDKSDDEDSSDDDDPDDDEFHGFLFIYLTRPRLNCFGVNEGKITAY